MKIKSQDEYALSFAKYLPNGELWISKNIPESNLYKLLFGLAYILIDVDIKINELKTEFYPVNTEKFIEEWEELLGIPDGCLKNDGNLEERKINIIGALGALGAVTKQDFINIAVVMGFEIKIEHMTDVSAWSWTWPHMWGGTPKQNRFIMIVTFLNLPSVAASLWPWIWQHLWGDDVSLILRCIFNRIKPAHTEFVYRYQ